MAKLVIEISALWKLALPVSLAQLAIVGMSATDVLIAGRAGTIELAGMNLGTNIWNMVIFFFLGIGFATQPLIANQYGAGNVVGLKHQMHQSLWTCFYAGVIAMLVVWLAWWAMRLLSYEATMLHVATSFVLVISLCAIPMVLIPAVRGTLEGMSLTREVFWINLTGFLLNIPLDYALVHGLWGLPELGGVGCAWATVVIIWLMLGANVLMLNSHPALRERKLFSQFESPHWPTIVKTLKLGVPIGISVAIELSMFAGAGLLIASLGAAQASAHAVAITIASVSFMLYLGVGQGITIRASQFLGAGKAKAAWYTVKVGIGFNLILSVLISFLFLLFARELIALFSHDNEVVELAILLLYFGAIFQIADCLQISAINGLRAYHDTVSPPICQFIAFWIVGMPFGIALTFYAVWPGLDNAQGMWMAMVVALIISGSLLTRNLLRIEKDDIEHVVGRANAA